MSEPLVVSASFEVRGPGDGVGLHNPAGTATASGVAAANLDLGILAGGQFVSFQARTGDIYIRLKTTATAAATTAGDASNGVKIPLGTTARFWITPQTRFVDHIASVGASTLFWWISSPNYITGV